MELHLELHWELPFLSSFFLCSATLGALLELFVDALHPVLRRPRLVFNDIGWSVDVR